MKENLTVITVAVKEKVEEYYFFFFQREGKLKSRDESKEDHQQALSNVLSSLLCFAASTITTSAASVFPFLFDSV